jgi:cellulose synthase/poly-beta-1,6-N-acetylglucosamine synthase-like glycosyltransferase
MVLLSIIAVLFITYAVLIIYFWQAWISIPEFKITSSIPSTKISLIIPARNEEENIAALLRSIKEQTYPEESFEVIVIDDNSTDNTVTIVKQFPFVNLISLKENSINSYKKKAIEIGIAAASGKLMVTTDADCIVQPNWLTTIQNFHQQTNSVFIVAPVVITSKNSFVQLFQAMDFMVLQGITGASVHREMLSMCNGANLAYEKKAFHSVNGFTDIDHIASGDDMLLMYKIYKQYEGRVQYLKSKEAIVATQPVGTWTEFFNQRIRWASKADKYDDKRIFWVLLIVYVFNLSFLFLLIAGLWNSFYWWGLLMLLAAKTVIELPFVISIASFFDQKNQLKYFIFFQPVHILYTIAAGWLGKFGSYEWKGRKVK